MFRDSWKWGGAYYCLLWVWWSCSSIHPNIQERWILWLLSSGRYTNYFKAEEGICVQVYGLQADDAAVSITMSSKNSTFQMSVDRFVEICGETCMYTCTVPLLLRCVYSTGTGTGNLVPATSAGTANLMLKELACMFTFSRFLWPSWTRPRIFWMTTLTTHTSQIMCCWTISPSRAYQKCTGLLELIRNALDCQKCSGLFTHEFSLNTTIILNPNLNLVCGYQVLKQPNQ